MGGFTLPQVAIAAILGGSGETNVLGGNKAAILRNHGLLTVGTTVDAAVWFFVAMNRSAHAQLLAEAAGTPHLIDHENATLTRGQVGSEAAGWFSFQPMFEWISKLEPDLFD